MSRAIVLIDGGYFDHINNYCRQEHGSKVDIQKFGEKIASYFESDLLRLKYYHSLPYKDENPTPEQRRSRERAQSFFDTVDDLPKCQHIDAGRVQQQRHNCPECNASYKKPSQKGTDVQIAVDLVEMAYNPQSPDSYIVVSGDEDLHHGVRVAKDTHSNVYLGFAYDPSYDLYSSQVLRQEADDLKTEKEDESTAQEMVGCDPESCGSDMDDDWITDLPANQLVTRDDVLEWWESGDLPTRFPV